MAMTDRDDRLPSRMLIGRERLFYSGLVGNAMSTRRLGGQPSRHPRRRRAVAEAPHRRRSRLRAAPAAHAERPHRHRLLRARDGRRG
jgi:hypothetical protein